jgi:hypothetical protein
MPLVYRNEPDEAAEAVRNGLEQMASKGAFSTPRLRSAFAEKAVAPATEKALPVYNLGLSDLVKDQNVKASPQIGWRYTLKQNNEIIAHAETVVDHNGRNLFAGTNEGPLVEGTTKAIKAAEKKSEIKMGNYEVRLLFIPALYVTALWLVDKEGKADLAMPIEPAPAFLTPNKLMPLEDLLAVVQEKAKSKLESYHGDDTLGG